MSLAINPDRIEAILIGNTWHPVATCYIDAFEFVYDADARGDFDIAMGGGQDVLTSATGISWQDLDGDRYAAPMRALQAVRYRRDP